VSETTFDGTLIGDTSFQTPGPDDLVAKAIAPIRYQQTNVFRNHVRGPVHRQGRCGAQKELSENPVRSEILRDS